MRATIRLMFVACLVLVTLRPGNSCVLAQSGAQRTVEAKYEANWESLDKRATPKWWVDAKFGILVCWGFYSVPGWSVKGQYAEWYWARVERDKKRNGAWWQYHAKSYGEDFECSDFVPMFKAELFEPVRWAEVFRRSGAKYVILTAKYHDGFCLWPCAYANKAWGRPWNSVDAGPKRDLLGELGEAVRNEGLRMGLYYSLYEWYNPLWLSDRAGYVDEHMLPQFKDVVRRYKPSVIFADGEWDLPAEEWRSEEFLGWLFNESPCKDEVAVNDRWGKGIRHKHGGYYTTEYGAGLKGTGHAWEENRGMGHSFGYSRAESLSDYRSGRELVLMLIDFVSRGGNFLLDIGPTADGRIPVIMEERLLEIGQWLEVNGEAIYGTRPWRKSVQWSEGERPEVGYGKTYRAKYDIKEMTKKPSGGRAVIEAFFTSKGNILYAITPRRPVGKFVLTDVKPSKKTAVTILGLGKPLEFQTAGGNVAIEVPQLSIDEMPCRDAYVFRLTNVR